MPHVTVFERTTSEALGVSQRVMPGELREVVDNTGARRGDVEQATARIVISLP
jgi:hypothetical protein